MQRYQVPGITCSHCEQAIVSALADVAGVTSVEVSLDDKIVYVDGDADRADVIAAIDDAGYEAVGLASVGERPGG